LINVFSADVDAKGENCFGAELGAAMWSGTIYELAPGKRICPYHWHFDEEEWLLVVSGTPTLRTPEGERVLEPWDVAVFVTGEAGGHEVRNESAEPVRVLMLSNLFDPAVTVYPESGKVGVLAGWSRKDGQVVRLRNRPEANLDYWDGEER
jgi:uncharacterized cupin superfamily protein